MLIECVQVNLHKAKASYTEYRKLIDRRVIGLVTEPYTVDSKIVCFESGFLVVPPSRQDLNPRAGIIVPPQVSFIYLIYF